MPTTAESPTPTATATATVAEAANPAAADSMRCRGERKHEESHEATSHQNPPHRASFYAIRLHATHSGHLYALQSPAIDHYIMPEGTRNDSIAIQQNGR